MNPLQDLMFRRSLAYKQCFLGEDNELTPAAKIVLADLAKYAGMGAPTVVSPVTQQVDTHATSQRIGRGDVVNRVWRYLRLPIHKLFEIEASHE